MMVPKNILDSCREYLHCNHILCVNENWLTEAIEYFINMFGAEDVQMIHLAVKKQWYGHDLTKISSGCLPQNLKACKKTILSGHYTLQINSITSLEIFSEHKQYLMCHVSLVKKMKKAVKKLDLRVLEDKMLQLYMTDGVQEVTGIVFEPIENLYVNTVPGMKVFIKGPLVCYGDFLLLSNKNCQLLDGDVEELMSEQFEQTKHLMELIKMHGLGQGMSLNENGKSDKSDEINIINQPSCVEEFSVNSNIISNRDETNIVNKTISNLIETSRLSESLENEFKLRSLKRSKENDITNSLPGTSANYDVFFDNESESLRKKAKEQNIQIEECRNGLVNSPTPQNQGLS